MSFTTTTNMTLSVPASGTTVAEDWVTSVNGWATTIDVHDHTSGKGLRIPPTGLNINADLEYNENSATELAHAFFEDRTVDPATTKGLYTKSGELYFRDGSGNVIQVTDSGSLNTGALNAGLTGAVVIAWYADEADAPFEGTEYNHLVWQFSPGDTQTLRAAIKVPQSYTSGNQIRLYANLYSPSTSNTILLSTVTTLIRKNNDAFSDTTNQHTSTNSALTNTVADQLRETSIDLTDGSGQINSIFVNPGDTIKVALSRGTDTDTADLRFVQNSSEVTFS